MNQSMKASCLLGFLFCSRVVFANADPQGEGFESKSAAFSQLLASHIPLSPNGKIAIPDHIKHIKLDIGLSYSAPMSQYWLSHESDLFVFGFEPNPEAVKEIRKGAVKRNPVHGEPLDVKFIDKVFFLIPCALGLSEQEIVNFYLTKEDWGCSSIYEPNYLEVEKVLNVPIFPLANFFDMFPFDTHPIIEYIKIDTQGADLNIVKSAGKYLEDHVIYITIEPENFHYKNTNNSLSEIDSYMHSIGFRRHQTHDVCDPTYINLKFLKYIERHDVKIHQW